MAVLIAFVIVVVVVAAGVTGLGFEGGDCVFITVSSLWQPASDDGKPMVERELELNWVMDPVCGSPDHLGLFSHDPRSTQADAMLWLETGRHPDGFYRTNVSLGRPPLPGGWDEEGDERTSGDHCYPYWLASFNEIAILHATCLKIRPTWMADHKRELSSLKLSELVIPGTHNSACYHHGNASSQRRDAFTRYLLTQDANMWSQLVHGVRYLDLRVGYYVSRDVATRANTEDRFWVNHAMVRVTSLVPVLREISRFVAAAPDEVVIVDFHRFPIGLQGRRKRHRQLVALLKKELGHLALPPPEMGTTYKMGDIWRQSRRLVVAYGEKDVAKASKWLWPPLSQQWGSQQSPSGLRGYIDEVMTKQRPDADALWSVMAELTPTPFDVLFDISGSLRQMADSVNRNLTTWIRDIWWQRANIVASDFFLGNHVIDVAVRANQRKAKIVNE